MKIKEIIENPPRDEYIDNYRTYFNGHTLLGKIKDHSLIKKDDGDFLYYGLLNYKNELILYLSLEWIKDKEYVVGRTIADSAYQQQGWITALFDYVIGDDKLKIYSDDSQTPSAIKTWSSFKRNNRFGVYIYDKKTGQKIETALINGKIYSRDGHIDPYSDIESDRWVLLAESTKKDLLSEHFNQINRERRQKNKWTIIWYGPEVKDKDFWNP